MRRGNGKRRTGRQGSEKWERKRGSRERRFSPSLWPQAKWRVGEGSSRSPGKRQRTREHAILPTTHPSTQSRTAPGARPLTRATGPERSLRLGAANWEQGGDSLAPSLWPQAKGRVGEGASRGPGKRQRTQDRMILPTTHPSIQPRTAPGAHPLTRATGPNGSLRRRTANWEQEDDAFAPSLWPQAKGRVGEGLSRSPGKRQRTRGRMIPPTTHPSTEPRKTPGAHPLTRATGLSRGTDPAAVGATGPRRSRTDRSPPPVPALHRRSGTAR